VQDQEGDFQVEHLIHDGGSGIEFDQWASNQQGAICVSERDEGMYDAINRGFSKSTGDVIAWLNCDEQYLPGALQVVSDFFRLNPTIDILFGDVILINENLVPLAYRRAVLPTVGHIRYSHLSTFSAATFVRKKILDEGHFLNTHWKTIADAVWIDELLSSGYQAATINVPLAVFSMLGTNLGQSKLLYQERHEWELKIGANHKTHKHIHVWHYRIKRLLAGAYLPRKVSVSAFKNNGAYRIFTRKWVSGQWNSAVSEAANLRNEEDGGISGLLIKKRVWYVTSLHSIFMVAFAIMVDRLSQGDAVKGPFILLFSLMYLSFKSRTKDLFPIALLYFLTAAYLLSERPTDVMIVRLGTFSLGAILALFWTSSVRNLESWIQSTVGLIRRLPVPVILVNSDGVTVLANRAACSVLRMNEKMLISNKFILKDARQSNQKLGLLNVQEWGERVPTDIISISLSDKPSLMLGYANVLCVGRGRFRFYAFTLKKPENTNIE